MITFTIIEPKMDPEYLGIIPMFFHPLDPRTAAQQVDANYQHGGGWDALPHCTEVKEIPFAWKYPGDPVFTPLAIAKLRDEVIVLYEGAFLGIWQRDGSFEISRVD